MQVTWLPQPSCSLSSVKSSPHGAESRAPFFRKKGGKERKKQLGVTLLSPISPHFNFYSSFSKGSLRREPQEKEGRRKKLCQNTSTVCTEENRRREAAAGSSGTRVRVSDVCDCYSSSWICSGLQEDDIWLVDSSGAHCESDSATGRRLSR
jgi:hypothetical protein